MKNEKVIGSIIFFVIAAFFFTLSLDFPVGGNKSDVGPSFMPQLYAVFLFFFSFLLLIQGVRENIKKNAPVTAYPNIALVGIIMLCTAIYVLLIPYLGFYLVSIVFMFGFLKFTKVKKMTTLLLVPICTNLFLFIFFEKMLMVPVPVGILFS